MGISTEDGVVINLNKKLKLEQNCQEILKQQKYYMAKNDTREEVKKCFLRKTLSVF